MMISDQQTWHISLYMLKPVVELRSREATGNCTKNTPGAFKDAAFFCWNAPKPQVSGHAGLNYLNIDRCHLHWLDSRGHLLPTSFPAGKAAAPLWQILWFHGFRAVRFFLYSFSSPIGEATVCRDQLLLFWSLDDVWENWSPLERSKRYSFSKSNKNKKHQKIAWSTHEALIFDWVHR